MITLLILKILNIRTMNVFDKNPQGKMFGVNCNKDLIYSEFSSKNFQNLSTHVRNQRCGGTMYNQHPQPCLYPQLCVISFTPPHIMDAYGLIIIEFIKINYSVIIKMIFLQIFTPCLEN